MGELLYKQSAGTVKKISLELGGNAPFIVFDDADVDAVVEGGMLAKFRNTGQVCVAAIFRFENEDQVIRLANDTRFGLASYFYARDINRVWKVAEALEYGMVGINTGIMSTEVAPFGGIKESGMGREGSKYGIDEYLETKYMCFGGI